MRILYDILIFIYNAGIRIAAFSGNAKARLWTEGRKNQSEKINKALAGAGKRRVWFHCASLGEFEQGRPLIEKLKSEEPSVFIVLTFFSPSGYELRKNYRVADLVCYLPVDNRKNAFNFIRLVSPQYVVFIKYEFWLNYFDAIRNKNIPLFIVSAIFRPSQIFFKWYGGFYRNILRNVNHFFVQDEGSAKLLARFDFNNTTVSGDTRFDRVYAVATEEKKIDILERFRQQDKVFIAGSSWPEDEEIYLPALRSLKMEKLKLVIAPHEVSKKRIDELEKKLSAYYNIGEIARFSSVNNPESKQVLIIDNIGFLSSAYRYGTISWIGGGFGKGIHNILEAAVFGMPVIFGPKYEKFREAVELTALEGAFSVRDRNEAVRILSELLNDDKKFLNSSRASSEYVHSRTGATNRIYSSLPALK